MSIKEANPLSIKSFSIAGNSGAGGNFVDIQSGIMSLQYYESILSDTKSMNVTFIDTGGSVKRNKSGQSTYSKSILEGLPLVGGEKCLIKMTDNYENNLGEEDSEIELYVNVVSPIVTSEKNQMISLNLVSKEYLLNDKINIYKRFDGKISQSVKDILENILETDKDLDIEETYESEYSFVGNGKKPFYILNTQSKKAFPSDKGKKAGFFLWETHDGYHFKSIDTLLNQEAKIKIMYTGTNDVPDEKALKALQIRKDVSSGFNAREKVGTHNTKLVVFDPFTTFYGSINLSSERLKDDLNLSGENFPVPNGELQFQDGKDGKDGSTRTTYTILDTGTLPQGDTNEQIERSSKITFEVDKILNQSFMRYNQLFTFKVECTIAANFSLHAGDAIEIEMPQLTKGDTSDYDEDYGGLYIISELCHHITPTGSFTKLNLVRDSIGKKI